MHALTGCDILVVSYLWGVGKNIALKVFTKGQGLQLLCTEDTTLTGVVREATEFIAACYGFKERPSLSAVWYQVWATKTARKNAFLCLKLKSLLPTTEAFCEHVKYAHNQGTEWKGALKFEPPVFDPTKSGFCKEEASKTCQPLLCQMALF